MAGSGYMSEGDAVRKVPNRAAKRKRQRDTMRHIGKLRVEFRNKQQKKRAKKK